MMMRGMILAAVVMAACAGVTMGQTAPATGPASAPATAAANWKDLKGEMITFKFEKSSIFPGTVRDVWVYVPAEYDGTKEACLFVDQDRVQFNAPAVFDDLIAKKQMPVTIGVFVSPGVVPAAGENALPRYNRSFEYDGLGDNYARFLIEELLPEVEKKTTKDGKAIKLSKNS